MNDEAQGVRNMSVKTKLEEIYEQVAQLTPAEWAELRQWLDQQMNGGEDEGEEMTEADLLNALKSYEEAYGLSSDEFVRRYDARDPEVLRFDQCGFWRTIYSLWEQARDDASKEQARLGDQTTVAG
jgi:hypothetical protein